MSPDKKEIFRKGLKRISDLLVGDRISLQADEQDDGLVLRLKTEFADEGLPIDDFTNREHRLNFTTEDKTLLYLPRAKKVRTQDWYRLATWLLEEIKRKEGQGHYGMLAGNAALSMKRILRRKGEMPLSFPRVYAVCAHYFDLPSFEKLDPDNFEKIQVRLEAEERDRIIGGHNLELSGIGLFKNLQWDEKGTRIFVFDPCETYRTGSPMSMQFREDLERYAKLAQKQA